MNENKTGGDSFMLSLGAPATRALKNKGIDSLEKLSQFTEQEILKLHGVGKTAIPKLKDALKAKGLAFKK